jgi:hypothetical protein
MEAAVATTQVLCHASQGQWGDVFAALRDRQVTVTNDAVGGHLLAIASGRPSFSAVPGPCASSTFALLTLLQNGANPNAYDGYGTALHYACLNGNLGHVCLLLNWGSNAGLSTVDGQWPLALHLKGERCFWGSITSLVGLLGMHGAWRWRQEARVAAAMGRQDVADMVLCAKNVSVAKQSWMKACVCG